MIISNIVIPAQLEIVAQSKKIKERGTMKCLDAILGETETIDLEIQTKLAMFQHYMEYYTIHSITI